MTQANHETMMAKCIALAQQGAGFVEPNPCVGSLVVNDGVIVGRGYHQELGGGHGEANALRDAGDHAGGADLYVTLEPCSTTGRTPPCAQLIIDSGIKRVFIGAIDPNPNHQGRAVQLLEAAGIDVRHGILKDRCESLIADFERYLSRSTPVVVAKWASTLDGKIATESGDSRWITAKESRVSVHQERARCDAILVGIGTVFADDPSLTVRHVKGDSPQPVILDSHLRIGLSSKILQASDRKPWIYCIDGSEKAKIDQLGTLGCVVVEAPSSDGLPDLDFILKDLKVRGIARVLVEGGARIHGSFFDKGLVDLVHAYVAPKILGDQEGRSAVAGRHPLAIADTVDLEWLHVDPFGPDLRLVGRVLPK
ncbi:MAG: diaminohydroxyphosphoribosylaminopyrimidine deaminase [Planctomycetota bacterium]|jgi:diaminohydroxyphosphoribosylaminopyrimidine deaminase/5-amino-6-(5-phosphoribosylamino)uracil reductase